MSDLHLDYDYTEGTSNVCGAPLCCRSDSGPAKSNDTRAGKWGDYNCDIPVRTMNSLLSMIKDEIKPDVVFWGGDSVPHNIESLTFDTNVEIIKNITSEVKAGLDGLKIFPAIGNHDTYPQDEITMTAPQANKAIN